MLVRLSHVTVLRFYPWGEYRDLWEFGLFWAIKMGVNDVLASLIEWIAILPDVDWKLKYLEY